MALLSHSSATTPPSASTRPIARPAARSPLNWTSSVIGVSGPGSASARLAELKTGNRSSIRSSNSPSNPSGAALPKGSPWEGTDRGGASTGSAS
ncbi:Uncharacterised protein [Mycobacterium tuberculosis]|uniref:Uncharacterized protein n=1 Tax=Mycobacterium tuberculosis TaxID=1773 RepID=A0A916L9E3_MYCTX|nr:Uncharacterised protein [Mycobacterium tuberculosis]COX74398.1 Uncharacterised protein [Mycobacterium tuberculosis]